MNWFTTKNMVNPKDSVVYCQVFVLSYDVQRKTVSN
jgi:hypothetical protein